MPFHIANLALSPRVVVQKPDSRDDPYHEDHQLAGNILLYKLSEQKGSLWNSIISFLQTRAHEIDAGVDDEPWCLLFVKDRASLEETLSKDDLVSTTPNRMPDLHQRIWLSRIRICYTPTSHHLRALISAMHIRTGQSKDSNGILQTLDKEYPDRAPSLLAVYNLMDITDNEPNDRSRIHDTITSNQLKSGNDDLMHIMASLSELLVYYNSSSKTNTHLIYYDSKQQHTYHSEVENQSVIPVTMEISSDVKIINNVFHCWTDWIVEADILPLDTITRAEHLGKFCISLVAVPSRRTTATEDLHWTFEV
ncbi:hypothetical protein BGW37DRAFT_56514 [Umbelopsis sp. PMI_123]|nr:hypothetical protein BGW37DRAFT_56514 [Umbelopsis sp. PMI_123]